MDASFDQNTLIVSLLYADKIYNIDGFSKSVRCEELQNTATEQTHLGTFPQSEVESIYESLKKASHKFRNGESFVSSSLFEEFHSTTSRLAERKMSNDKMEVDSDLDSNPDDLKV